MPTGFLFPVCRQSCRSPAAEVLLQRSAKGGLSYLRLQCGLNAPPVQVLLTVPSARPLPWGAPPPVTQSCVPDFARSRVALGSCRALCARRWPAHSDLPRALPQPPSCFPNHLAGLLAGLDAFRFCCAGGMCDRGATGGLPDSFAFGARLRTSGHLLVPLRATGFNCEKPSAKNSRRT